MSNNPRHILYRFQATSIKISIMLMTVFLFAGCGEEEKIDKLAELFQNPANLVLPLGLTAPDAISEVTAIVDIDLQKWLGTWYQLAHIPAWFDIFCDGGTIANYSLDTTGDVIVDNSCVDPAGDIQHQIGRAKILDSQQPGQLAVAFFGQEPEESGANYWILYRSANYDFAVVGHPQREFGWILSRNPVAKQSQIDLAATILVSYGYNLADFVLTDQRANIEQ